MGPGSVTPVESPMSESDSAAQQKRDTSKMRHRVSVRDEIYTKLKEESKRQGKPVVQLATEAIAEYLENIKPDEAPIPQSPEEQSEGM